MTSFDGCDATHDPQLTSWVESAQSADTDFPIQNLPFGRFRVDASEPYRLGVAIGDQILDLQAAGLVSSADMQQLIAQPRVQRRALRQTLSQGLRQGSAQEGAWRRHLHAQSSVQMGLPCDVRDYTDFYVGIHHATAVGKMFRPDNPLLPNYKWVPIGYHGRASSLLVSGQDFRRPLGQIKAADRDVPQLAPCQRLDLELELGVIIGQGNAQGEPVTMADAEDHIFGLTLFNDWSARDVQAWEYQPLGPFLSKNFASTLSPWMVTLDALAPFRKPFVRDAADPQPLSYLSSAANSQAGAVDIDLQVLICTQRMRESGMAAQVISRSNFAEAAYWTLAQLVAHHTIGGCNLSTGDLFGTGTLSGPKPDQAGSLLELTSGGKSPITLTNGETRTFLQDGDEITLRGQCRREGFRTIGLGECRGTVRPAPAPR